MLLSDLPELPDIEPLVHALDEVPHATLETNLTCNLHCAHCYNGERDSVKSLSLLLAELDTLRSLRRLHTITLLGGEPTLHPDLPALVRAVKERGLSCQLMTNGLALEGEEGALRLDQLVSAGVDRFALHVDEGQGEPAAIASRRQALFGLMESRRVHFSLTLTLDDQAASTLPGLVLEGAAYRYFDGILAFLAADWEHPRHQEQGLIEHHRQLQLAFDLQPTAYLPSNLDPQEVRWLLYHFLLGREGRASALSARFNRCFTRAHRLLLGRNPFMVLCPPGAAGIGSLAAWCAEWLLSPRHARAMARRLPLRQLWRGARFFFVAIGAPPERPAAGKEISICYHCPDATLRNGFLVPVCLADQISPLAAGTGFPAGVDPSFAKVLAHLGNPEMPR
jgi:hypothetical protein